MWTATVARTERNEDRLDIIVTYTNGVTEFSKTYSADAPPSDPNWLQTQIQNQLNNLFKLDAYEQVITETKIVSKTLEIASDTLELAETKDESSRMKLVGE
jgi:hypothetical protein